jgi:predicted secreted protein
VDWGPGIVVFVIIWWLVLFCVLPWGVRQPDTLEPGHAAGAPENPRMWLRFAVTTLIATVLWGVAYFVAASGWISFRGAA